MRFVPSSPTAGTVDKIPASFSSFRASPESSGLKKSKKVTPKSSGCIQKSSQERKEKRQRQETMETLRDLLPNVPHGQEVGKLELLQGVIDYIFELQQQLLTPCDEENSSNQQELFSGDSSSVSPEIANFGTCRLETPESGISSQFDSLSFLLQEIGTC